MSDTVLKGLVIGAAAMLFGVVFVTAKQLWFPELPMVVTPLVGAAAGLFAVAAFRRWTD